MLLNSDTQKERKGLEKQFSSESGEFVPVRLGLDSKTGGDKLHFEGQIAAKRFFNKVGTGGAVRTLLADVIIPFASIRESKK